MPTLTVFTPTFNRRYVLERLYKSLCAQTNKDFVWLIVDDGSTDDTAAYVKKWSIENVIDIRYFFQPNTGKAMAHNRGVAETDTVLFTCVDSDDYLVADAVDTIVHAEIDRKDCIGILYKKGLSISKPISFWNGMIDYSTIRDAFYHSKLRGEVMLVYKSEAIKKHEFPFFQGEKFVPESYLYDQLDQEGQLLFQDKILCICEYLQDGYSANMRRVIADSPKGYSAFIKQRIAFDRQLKYLLPDLIKYVSISMVLKEKKLISCSPRPTLTLLCYLPGFAFYELVYKKYCPK